MNKFFIFISENIFMMKRLLATFILLTIFSCSSDNSNEPTVDEIVGTWQLTQELVDNTDTTTECHKNNTIQFKEDFFYIFKNFSQNNNSCTLSSTIENTPWTKSNGNIYNINGENYTLEGNTLTKVKTKPNGVKFTTIYTKK